MRALQRLLGILPVSVTLDHPALERGLGLEGAAQLAEMGFDWVYIDFFDGYPPDQTSSDEAIFEAAVRYFHEHQIKVSAGIRVASAYAVESYAQKEWYARDPHQQLLCAGAKRFYTVIDHPQWIAEVEHRITTVLSYGVDGVVLREVSMGADGYTIGGLTMGMVGSHDEQTVAAYLAETGAPRMPRRWRDVEPVRHYLAWRAKRLHSVLDGWIANIREQQPTCRIEIELRDPLTRPTYATQGLDLALYDRIDGVQVFSTHPDHDRSWWVHNVLARGMVHNQSALIKVGVDEVLYHTSRVPPPQSYLQSLVRALAQGDVPHVQSVIKRHNNSLSSVLHRRYLPYQNTISSMNQWLIENHSWLSSRQPASPLAIYLPSNALQKLDARMIHILSMVVHSLMVAGLPVGFVDDTNWQNVDTLIVPPVEVPPALTVLTERGATIIGVGRRPLDGATLIWPSVNKQRLRLWVPPFFGRRLNQWAVRIARYYHKRRFVRWAFDWVMRRQIIQRRLQPVQLPTSEMINDLSRAVPASVPYVEAPVPILYTIWREPDGKMQHYLVNTTRDNHTVTLQLHDLVSAQLYPIDASISPAQMVGSALTLSLDVAKVIRTQSATIQSTDVQ